jgi:hypothetical protein
MEDDRVQVDLGIAAEIEEKQIHENAVKQPKKRFVGRRAAAEAAKSSPGTTTSIEDSGAIQGNETFSLLCFVGRDADGHHSCPAKEGAEDAQPSSP